MAKRSGLLLLLSAAILAGLGLVMLASTNFYIDPSKGGGESYRNVWSHSFFLGLGLVALLATAVTNYHRWNHLRWPLFLIGLTGMLLCLFGREINGAKRWLELPMGIGGQPSEFHKIAFIVMMAALLAGSKRPGENLHWKDLLLPCVAIGVTLVAFWLQRDLGNAVIVALIGFTLLFVAGARLWHLGALAAPVIAVAAVAVITTPNRLERIKAVMNLEETRSGVGLQQDIATLAFGSGGIQGRGLGEGRMKLSYLPEAHTDFIFPVVGEELGLVGTSATVLLFVLLLVSGMCIAAYAPDRFGKLLGMGLTSLLACQALLNMGVTTALFPNKGLPLPFVSHGGSNLVAGCLVLGILVNIHRQGVFLTRSQLPVIRRKNRWTPQI